MKILEQYSDRINGVFSFFDRIIIKGYITRFFTTNGAGSYASQCNVLLKDFSAYAQGVTEEIKAQVKKKNRGTRQISHLCKIAQRIQGRYSN